MIEIEKSGTAKMERHKLFTGNKSLAYIVLVSGGITLIYGIGSPIFDYANNGTSDGSTIGIALHGILFTFLAIRSLRSQKYFIEWDDLRMNYLLPDNKSTETIEFSRIIKVVIKLFEIHITIDDVVKVINVENLQFREIKLVKQKFEQNKADFDND